MLVHVRLARLLAFALLLCTLLSITRGQDFTMNINPDGNTETNKPAPSLIELTQSLRPAPDTPPDSDTPVMETTQEAIMRQLRDSLPGLKLGQTQREKEFQQILLDQIDREQRMTDRAKRVKRPASSVNLYVDELAEYDGSDDDKPIYVSVWRKIYDITDGVKYYGGGMKYNYLSGKEVGRAMATGCFESTGLTYDMRGLSDEQKGSVRAWQEFYGKKYRHVGYLKGKKVDETSPIPSDNCEEAERYGGRPQV